MTNLSVTWLGLPLSSPFVVGASPISDDLDAVAHAIDAGASAVVMRSLFEEQLTLEQLAAHRYVDAHVDGGAEARTFLPESQAFSMGAEPYLRRLEKLRKRFSIPEEAATIADRIVQKRHHDWIEAFLIQHLGACCA